MGVIKVAIDAGHGSNTAGKRTCVLTKDIGRFKKGTQIREHWFNTYVAMRLYDFLIAMGYDVFKSAWNDEIVTDDEDVALSKRQADIKAAKCDYSISIHANAYGDGNTWNSAKGVTVLYHSNASRVGDSKKMARYILDSLLKGTPQKDRGIQPDELAMCNCTSLGTKAAVLVECAFMTNQEEVETMLANEDFWVECAYEIAIGFNNYVLSTLTVPTKSIKKGSSSANDVKWLQIKLNSALRALGSSTVLKIDGSYGPKTTSAVLEFWRLLGWNKDNANDGTVAGEKTRERLKMY